MRSSLDWSRLAARVSKYLVSSNFKVRATFAQYINSCNVSAFYSQMNGRASFLKQKSNRLNE
eukprot:m.137464 g.137464  ORF g.137464 m.137464 type:complete len:62 (+) comp38219_c0_seq33:3186-3371(+)